VAIAWREAKELLALVERGDSLTSELRPRIAFLRELASDLESARDLPHFNTAVRPRLKTREFEKARYEMQVAALFTRTGQHVEFVPRSRRRTPDLKVVLGDHALFVECTRKDAYRPDRDDDSPVRRELLETILSLQKELRASLEVVVIVVGTLNERVSAEVLAEARRAIETGARGRTNAREGVTLLLREPAPPPPPTGSVGVSLRDTLLSPNTSKRLARSEGILGTDSEGRLYVKSVNTAAVYVIDSHKVTSIVDAFQPKRGQIPEQGGLVYMSLDVSHVAEGDVDFYMQAAGSAVSGALLTPPENTRISAVILMTDLIPLRVVLADGQTSTALGRRSHLVRNPSALFSLPVDLIPG
jgi:hypothetical protein